jgi:hypothetical protein
MKEVISEKNLRYSEKERERERDREGGIQRVRESI